MKSRRMRWEGHIAGMGMRGTHVGFWCERQKARGTMKMVGNFKMDL
jgi:hypothetical protein